MLLEIEKLYKFKVIKHLSIVFVMLFLYIAPLFTMEVYSLKKALDYRRVIIDNAKKNGRQKIYLDFVRPSTLLYDNLAMNYYDCLFKANDMSEMEGIVIEDTMENRVRYS